MRLRILHQARYLYSAPVVESRSEVRLMPVNDDEQSCIAFRLDVRPPARLASEETPGGVVHAFHIRTPHTALEIAAESEVETRRANPFESLDLSADDWDFYRRTVVRQEFEPFIMPTPLALADPASDRIAQIARRQAGPSVASFLVALTRIFYRVLHVDPRASHIHPALAHVLEEPDGRAQRFTHLMLGVCRSQGIPSRCAIGYALLESDSEDGEAAQVMHLWVECLLPGGAWRGFDPIHNQLVSDRYVKVHTGRDYADVAPTRGIYRGAATDVLETQIEVRAA